MKNRLGYLCPKCLVLLANMDYVKKTGDCLKCYKKWDFYTEKEISNVKRIS